MFSRFLIAVAAAAVVLGGSVCAKAAEVLNFGIISTESSQNLKQLWDPFLADMEKATGFKVKAFFASDRAVRKAISSSVASLATFMPRPPPPAVALMITG